jgi:hypothetical protein
MRGGLSRAVQTLWERRGVRRVAFWAGLATNLLLIVVVLAFTTSETAESSHSRVAHVSHPPRPADLVD